MDEYRIADTNQEYFNNIKEALHGQEVEPTYKFYTYWYGVDSSHCPDYGQMSNSSKAITSNPNRIIIVARAKTQKKIGYGVTLAVKSTDIQ